MKTPVNGQTLKQHLTYSWWKYALVIIIGALMANLYFTVSAYRSPPEKKIDVFVYGVCNESGFGTYLSDIRTERMPDMEEINCLSLATDPTYGSMQLSTYVAAGEGDVYILPRDQFISLASSGAWVPLENDLELTSLFTDRNISLQSGWRREADSSESHLYGIPASRLPGLARYVAVDNGYLCILITNGNDDNVLKFLHFFCEDMLNAPTVQEMTEE